jgi:hypothetical protein
MAARPSSLELRRTRRKQSHRDRIGIALELESDSPMPPFPSHLPLLVVDSGGGGLSTCEAVGARDWRIE